MGNRNSSYLLRASIFLITLFSFSCTFAQSEERPKLKDFGSSLKRIKWDPDKKTAVETKSHSISQTASDDVDVVRVETSLVTSDLLVLDPHGQFVAGLTQDDFTVTEDGTPQQVGMFTLGDSVSVSRSIVLIIDYSSSQFPYIETSVAAAKTLIDKLTPVDRMAIVTDNVELLQDFTKNKQQLKDKLDSLLRRLKPGIMDSSSLRRFGRSQQYSALMATLKEAFNNEDQRPIVIFQTDGDELIFLRNPPVGLIPNSGPFPSDKRARDLMLKSIKAGQKEFSLEDICRAAEKSRATIYTVIPGFQVLGLSPDDQVKQLERKFAALTGSNESKAAHAYLSAMTPQMWRDWADREMKIQAALAAVATSTGGWTMFLEKPADADHIYSSIFSDINRRYIVGYYPTNKEHDGKRRKMNVEVRGHPDYVVVGRRWYYAPAQDQ